MKIDIALLKNITYLSCIRNRKKNLTSPEDAICLEYSHILGHEAKFLNPIMDRTWQKKNFFK